MRKGADLPWSRSFCEAEDPNLSLRNFATTPGPGEEGAAGYCPKILLPKGPKWCSVLSIGVIENFALEIALSETKFLEDFWGPLPLPAPLFILLLQKEALSLVTSGPPPSEVKVCSAVSP